MLLQLGVHPSSQKLVKVVIFLRAGRREAVLKAQALQLITLGRTYGQRYSDLGLNETSFEHIEVQSVSSGHAITGAQAFLSGLLEGQPLLPLEQGSDEHFTPPIGSFSPQSNLTALLKVLPPIASSHLGQDILVGTDCPKLRDQELRLLAASLNTVHEETFKPLLDGLKSGEESRLSLLQAHDKCRELLAAGWANDDLHPNMRRQCELLLSFAHAELASNQSWRKSKHHVMLEKIREFIRGEKKLLVLSVHGSTIASFATIFLPKLSNQILSAYRKEFRKSETAPPHGLPSTLTFPFAASLALEIHAKPDNAALLYNGETVEFKPGEARIPLRKLQKKLRQNQDKEFTLHCGNPAYPRTYPLKTPFKLIYLLTFCIVVFLSFYAFFLDIYQKKAEEEAEPEIVSRE